VPTLRKVVSKDFAKIDFKLNIKFFLDDRRTNERQPSVTSQRNRVLRSCSRELKLEIIFSYISLSNYQKNNLRNDVY
jgi:hypothetical protein